MYSENVVSIWLGTFNGEDEFRAYIKESFSDDGEVSSEFSKAFDLTGIDYDFFESLCCSSPAALKKMVSQFSYATYFENRLALSGSHNCLIAVYNFDYAGSHVSDGRCVFAGAFQYTVQEQ